MGADCVGPVEYHNEPWVALMLSYAGLWSDVPIHQVTILGARPSDGALISATGSFSFSSTPVPEPTTIVLLGVGAISLLVFGRRQRRWVVLAGLIFLVVSPMEAATVAYYRFENGTANTAASGTNSILDSSGNGLNGTPVNGPVYTSNVPVNPVPQTGATNNLSMQFNGIDQRISIPDSPQFQLTHSLTLEAYIDPYTIPSDCLWHQILFRGDDRAGFDPYFLSGHEYSVDLRISGS